MHVFFILLFLLYFLFVFFLCLSRFSPSQKGKCLFIYSSRHRKSVVFLELFHGSRRAAAIDTVRSASEIACRRKTVLQFSNHIPPISLGIYDPASITISFPVIFFQLCLCAVICFSRNRESMIFLKFRYRLHRGRSIVTIYRTRQISRFYQIILQGFHSGATHSHVKNFCRYGACHTQP